MGLLQTLSGAHVRVLLDLCWNACAGLWKFTGLNSSTIGTEKTQKSEELKGFHDFSFPQASIRNTAIANVGSTCFDGHAEFKGKDRHDTDGSLPLGLGRLPDGWTSPSVS